MILICDHSARLRLFCKSDIFSINYMQSYTRQQNNRILQCEIVTFQNISCPKCIWMMMHSANFKVSLQPCYLLFTVFIKRCPLIEQHPNHFIPFAITFLILRLRFTAIDILKHLSSVFLIEACPSLSNCTLYFFFFF